MLFRSLVIGAAILLAVLGIAGTIIYRKKKKEDRIDISGKSEFYRVFFSILVLVIAVAVSKNLILSLIIMNVVAYGMIVLLDISIAVKRVSVRMTGDRKRLWELVKMCIPLAVSTFLSTYIINSSKLSVDRVLGDEAQLYYTAVFMQIGRAHV